MITGKVVDSVTRVPLQNVSITLKNSPRGTLTDGAGNFQIEAEKSVKKITFSITGYHSRTYTVTDQRSQELSVLLSKSYTKLADVVVNARKGKYKNKNNPAVELIRQVIANKSRNGPKVYPNIS
ncbi:MAG TPA: carboxypeptidase-like regulatory domain-containing protein, partial [Puia sp.]|nr:carboxypeptidase-like regulatory domain-containing protein [Puia sp.]